MKSLARVQGRMKVEPETVDLNLASGVNVGTPVRPGRVRNRNKAETDDKIKKPADESRKKSSPTRKAPARGRYVDEYARPTL